MNNPIPIDYSKSGGSCTSLKQDYVMGALQQRDLNVILG
jgi:hypothetical protein